MITFYQYLCESADAPQVQNFNKTHGNIIICRNHQRIRNSYDVLYEFITVIPLKPERNREMIERLEAQESLYFRNFYNSRMKTILGPNHRPLLSSEIDRLFKGLGTINDLQTWFDYSPARIVTKNNQNMQQTPTVSIKFTLGQTDDEMLDQKTSISMKTLNDLFVRAFFTTYHRFYPSQQDDQQMRLSL